MTIDASSNLIQFKDRANNDASVYPISTQKGIYDSSLEGDLTTYITEYNISLHQRNTTAGVGTPRRDTSIFTLNEAIAQVPDEYKHGGLKLTFNSDMLGVNCVRNYVLDSSVWTGNIKSWYEEGNNALVGYYTCTTATGTAAKTVNDASGYVLSLGGSMKINFTNKHSGNNTPTLNINGQGAKTILYDGSICSSTNTWENGETVECYYDGSVYQLNNVAGEKKFKTGEFVKETGIDSEPVNGSENLVKSGGVANVNGSYSIYENPEWIRVYVDSENRILFGIKSDGSIDWSLGVPTPIKNYISEYPNIVSFLNSIEFGEKTLQQLLDEKVNTEAGKSLIDTDFSNGISYIENPEFVIVYVDSKNKILFGINTDGNVYFGKGVPQQIVDTINEKLLLKVDKEAGKVLIKEEIANIFNYIENPEFVDVKTDSNNNILESFDLEGNKKVYTNVEIKENINVKKQISGKSIIVDEDLIVGGNITILKKYTKYDFVGAGSTLVTKNIVLDSSKAYKIVFPSDLPQRTSSTGVTAIFAIDKFLSGDVSGGNVFVIRAYDNVIFNNTFVLKPESDAAYYRFGVRSSVGENIEIKIYDITEEFNKENEYEIDLDEKGYVLNDSISITADSAPFMEIEQSKGICYVLSMGSDSAYGEAAKYLILTVFPALQPYRQEYFEVVKSGDLDYDGDTLTGGYEHCTVAFYDNDDFIIRCIFTNYHGDKMHYRDFNTRTKEFLSAPKKVQYYDDNNVLHNVSDTGLSSWIESQGGSWNNSGQVNVLPNKIVNDPNIWNDGDFIYTTLCAFSPGGNPLVVKSDDNFATFHLVTILPDYSSTETVITRLETTYYILCRGMGGIYFQTTDDFEMYSTPQKIVGTVGQKPDIISYNGKVYLFVPTNDNSHSIMGGRSAYHVYSGTGSDITQYKDELWFRNNFGMVYINAHFFNGRLFISYSTNKAMLGNNKSGKSTLMFYIVKNFYKN